MTPDEPTTPPVAASRLLWVPALNDLLYDQTWLITQAAAADDSLAAVGTGSSAWLPRDYFRPAEFRKFIAEYLYAPCSAPIHSTPFALFLQAAGTPPHQSRRAFYITQCRKALCAHIHGLCPSRVSDGVIDGDPPSSDDDIYMRDTREDPYGPKEAADNFFKRLVMPDIATPGGMEKWKKPG